MSFLSRLPHQIPFRAASAVRHVTDELIEGIYVCTANDDLASPLVLVEAMAQFGGALVFAEQAFVSGFDCELLRPVEPGDVVLCTVRLEAGFGGTYRFSGTGTVNGVDVVRGRFYLASAVHAQT